MRSSNCPDTKHVTVRVVFAPWAPVYILLMCKLGRTERYRTTLARFVLQNGVVIE